MCTQKNVLGKLWLRMLSGGNKGFQKVETKVGKKTSLPMK